MLPARDRETLFSQNCLNYQVFNQSIKYSFIDKKGNPHDTNASGFYRRVGGGKDE